MPFDLQSLLRENIRTLKPYTSARDEYKGTEGTFLDANENSFGSATEDLHNRYPDPLQWELKHSLSKIKHVPAENMLIGNGSDEPIDLLYRCFCRPGVDNVIITPPTYGMYEVSAHINDTEVKKVNLSSDFQLIPDEILAAVNDNTKLIFLCSPNNPTGNSLRKEDMLKVIQNFNGVVAVDEAYIDFAADKTMLVELSKYPNLVVMQTFSKAWGMANLRLGLAFASLEIISIFNKVKAPYNVNGVSQRLAVEAIHNVEKKDAYVKSIIQQRNFLAVELDKMSCIRIVYPSDSNFLFVKTTDGRRIYDFLIENKVIVRDRSNVALSEGCLRITVGTEAENTELLRVIALY
jgi:histidinol-phosphate aminotransferase